MRPLILSGLIGLIAMMIGLNPALAERRIGESGLPLPRFVTITSNKVNMRTGPGMKYPVEWVYQRRGLPVEIVEEYDTWRKIRDSEGAEGWVYEGMLSGRRGIVITGSEQILYREPTGTSAVVVRVEQGVIGRLFECDERWCEVKVGRYQGWMPRSSFWGTYHGEKIGD